MTLVSFLLTIRVLQLTVPHQQDRILSKAWSLIKLFTWNRPARVSFLLRLRCVAASGSLCRRKVPWGPTQQRGKKWASEWCLWCQRQQVFIFNCMFSLPKRLLPSHLPVLPTLLMFTVKNTTQTHMAIIKILFCVVFYKGVYLACVWL